MVDLYLEVQVDILRRYVTGSATVLDVGAGTGALTIPLSEAGYHVVAADGSKEMLSQLEKHSRATTLGPGGGIKTEEIDLFNLSRLGQKFDGAVSRWVLPHFEDYVEILKQVAHCLRDEGVFVFDFPSMDHVARSKIFLGEASQRVSGYQFASSGVVDPAYFYGSATDTVMTQALNDAGMEMIQRRPYGFLNANGLLQASLGPRQLKSLNLFLNRMVSKEGRFVDLMRLFEREVTPLMPAEWCHGTFVVARKRA